MRSVRCSCVFDVTELVVTRIQCISNYTEWRLTSVWFSTRTVHAENTNTVLSRDTCIVQPQACYACAAHALSSISLLHRCNTTCYLCSHADSFPGYGVLVRSPPPLPVVSRRFMQDAATFTEPNSTQNIQTCTHCGRASTKPATTVGAPPPNLHPLWARLHQTCTHCGRASIKFPPTVGALPSSCYYLLITLTLMRLIC